MCIRARPCHAASRSRWSRGLVSGTFFEKPAERADGTAPARTGRAEGEAMNAELKGMLGRFKELLTARVPVHRVVLFGSGARGEFGPGSDVDVVVIQEGEVDDRTRDAVSDCAWEAGFDLGLVIVPIAFSREEWECGPERHSLLARAVASDGVSI